MHPTRNIFMILYGSFPSDPRVRKEVLTLVNNANYKITIICLKEDSDLRIKNTNVISLMPNIKPSQRESIFNLLLFWILTTLYLLRQGTDLIIHAHDLTGLPAIILPSILRRVKKVIYDSHELFPEAAREELGWIFGLFFLILEKVCMIFVDTIVGISVDQQKLMEKRYKKPYILLPNYPSLKDINNFYLHEKMNFKNNKINIICHGSVRRDRGYFLLMDLMKKAQDLNFNWHMWVIGDGPDLEDSIKYSNYLKINNVTFTGKLTFKETFNYLRGGDLAIGLYKISASTCFTCSNKLYECMAAGIPSIFSDLSGSRSIMKEAKIVRVNPYKQKQIFTAVLKVIENKKFREKTSTKGQELIRDKYNWEKYVTKMLDYYRNIP